MKKRILIFSLAYFPHVGGAEVAVKEITDRIPDERFEFDMVTLRLARGDAAFERIGKINVHRVTLPVPRPLHKILFPLVAAYTGMRLHQRTSYHAAWSVMAAYAGFATLFFHRLTRVPYLLTLQEGDPIPYIEKKVRLVRPLFKDIFHCAAYIQTISTYLLEWAERHGGKNVSVVPNGVNLEKFGATLSKAGRDAVRRAWGANEKSVVLFTASRLVEKNGIEDGIRALALLPAGYRFVIAGTGSLEQHLKKVAEDIGVMPRVVFLGFASHEELPKLLASSDIFVRPSLSEGMGNSFIEAFAAKVPVIGTQEGGIADFLSDPDLNSDKIPTGRAVPVHDPQAIAHAATQYAQHPDETATIVKNAYALAVAKYSWDTIAPAMQRLFEAIQTR